MPRQVGRLKKKKIDENQTVENPETSNNNDQNEDPLAGIMEIVEEHPAPQDWLFWHDILL